jgi:hypothetical protein
VLNSEWLDIAVSVVLIWFLFALVVSAINEGVVRVLAIRSKQLWKGLSQLLDGTEKPTGLLEEVVGVPAWSGRPTDPHPGGGAVVTAKLYATKTIQGLENRTGAGQKTRIHNIPAPVFSHAVLEMALTAPGVTPIDRVRNYVEGLGDIPMKPQLQAVLSTADDDVNQFRAGVERWFDGQMSRLSGIYRAQVRVILAVIGIAVAVIGFGVGMRSDALALVSDLQHDGNFRTFVVGAATDAAQTDLARAGGCDVTTSATGAPAATATSPNLPACQFRGVAALKSIDLAFHDTSPAATAGIGQRLGFLLPWRHWRAFLGVLLTGLAISFGSSFWYNALKRLVGLQGGSQGTSAG